MKKLKYLVLMIIMLIAMVLCTGCGTTKVDLNKYVTVQAEGYDTMGRATYLFDREKFMEDYGDKIKLSDDVSSAQITSENVAEKLLTLCVQAELDKQVALSNGDVVTLKWTCKDELATEYFGCELKYSDIEYEVSELAEIQKFNPFEYMEIAFSGISGSGQAKITQDYNREEMQYITFSADKSWPLSNGDVVTLTANITGMQNVFVEKFGVVLEETTKEYVVDSLEEHVSEQSQLTEDVIQKMQQQGVDAYRADVVSHWDKPETLNDISYVGYYFLTGKEGMDNYTKNYMYFVYKVSAVNPGSGQTVEYYIGVQYRDITVLPDGTCNVDLGSYYITENTFLDGKYRYKGYEDLGSLYNGEVVSKINTYEYVTTIQE